MKSLILAVLVFGLTSQALSASVIVYTSRSTWSAAVSGAITNIDFEGLAPANGTTQFADSSGGLTLSGVNFMNTDSSQSVVAFDSGISFVGVYGSGATVVAYPGFSIFLPANTAAVGFDVECTFCALSGSNGTATVTLDPGGSFTNVAVKAPPTRSFIGFVSTQPISEVTLTTSPSLPMMDNFSFSSAVPEPGSVGLFFIGAGVLFWKRNSFRRR